MKWFSIISVLMLALVSSCSTSADAPMYEVNVSIEPFQTGSVSPSDSSYQEGTQITLQAEGADKYLFENWSGDVNETQNPLTITVDKDYSLTANFTLDPEEKQGTKEIARLTGSGSINQTPDNWHLTGTDLGHMFLHEGDIYMVFGDSDVGNRVQSNAMAVISDSDPWDGLTFDRMITEPIRPEYAKEIISRNQIPNQEKTVIPTYGVSVDGRMYLHYMALKQWGSAGEWQLNQSGIAYSDDDGQTWQISNLVWDGDSNFGQAAFVKHEGFVYIFGIPGGRFGDAKLARVPDQDLLNKNQYQYWNGSQWTGDQESAAVVIEQPVGELSVRWNSYYQKWILMTKRQERNGDGYGIVVLTADRLTGPWGNEKMILSDEEVSNLYGPYMPPKWNDGPNIFFTLSKFRPVYDVFWWRTSLSE